MSYILKVKFIIDWSEHLSRARDRFHDSVFFGLRDGNVDLKSFGYLRRSVLFSAVASLLLRAEDVEGLAMMAAYAASCLGRICWSEWFEAGFLVETEAGTITRWVITKSSMSSRENFKGD